MYAPGAGFYFMFRSNQAGNCRLEPNPKPAPFVGSDLKQVTMQYEGSPLYLGPLANLSAFGKLNATMDL